MEALDGSCSVLPVMQCCYWGVSLKNRVVIDKTWLKLGFWLMRCGLVCIALVSFYCEDTLAFQIRHVCFTPYYVVQK